MRIGNKWYIKFTVILIGIIATIFAMIQAASFLKLLLFSLFISILLIPACDWLESHKIPRILSTLLSIVGLILIFTVVFGFFFMQITDLIDNVGSLQEPFEELVTGLQEFLSTYFGFEGYIDFDQVKDSFYSYARENANAFTGWFSGMFSVFTSFVLLPVCVFLILIFRDFLYEHTINLFARQENIDEDTFENVLNKIKLVVGDYLIGILIVSSILAVTYSIMLSIIGVDYPIFFGIFAGALAIIPVVGPIVGSIAPVTYALLTMDSILYPIIILVGFIIVEAIEGNFLEPVILGRQVSLNALAALLLLFVGAEIWGLAGMILFIPIGAVLKVTFDEVEPLKPLGKMMGRVPDSNMKKSEWSKKVIYSFKKGEKK